jgi:hypothetical protein
MRSKSLRGHIHRAPGAKLFAHRLYVWAVLVFHLSRNR